MRPPVGRQPLFRPQKIFPAPAGSAIGFLKRFTDLPSLRIPRTPPADQKGSVTSPRGDYISLDGGMFGIFICARLRLFLPLILFSCPLLGRLVLQHTARHGDFSQPKSELCTRLGPRVVPLSKGETVVADTLVRGREERPPPPGAVLLERLEGRLGLPGSPRDGLHVFCKVCLLFKIYYLVIVFNI